MAIEIVSFPINSMVDLSSSLCKHLPEGTIKMVDLAIKHGDFP